LSCMFDLFVACFDYNSDFVVVANYNFGFAVRFIGCIAVRVVYLDFCIGYCNMEADIEVHGSNDDVSVNNMFVLDTGSTG